MKDAFAGKWQDALVKSLAPEIKTMISGQPTVLSFYLDFQELAKVLDNTKGMLSMFAPQQTDMPSILDQARLEALGKQGQMAAVVTMQDGLLEIRSRYQLPPVVK